MRTDAIFDIRSMCKPITVLGALLLVQDGRLKLDSSLFTMLPELVHVKVAGQDKFADVPLTIQQLMTPTPGIAAQPPPDLANSTRTFDRTLPSALPLLA